PSARSRLFVLITILALVLAATSVWIHVSRRTTAPSSPAPVRIAVVLNALPWAHVKVTPLSKNFHVEIPPNEKLTPCSLLLSEGEYTVEFSNDPMLQPLIKKIKVK